MMKLPPALILFAILSLLPSSSEGFLVSVADDQEIEVIANPHGKTTACTGGMLLDRLLEPSQLILSPMPTQADTFQELSYAKVLTVPVPVYTMKQPARLSQAELAFQLVLVKNLSTGTAHMIKEVPVPMDKASDSWFLGYYWTPIIMPCGENNYQHIGWKFTALEAAENNNNLPHFYALMVQMDHKEKTQALRVGGFKAPGWMVGAIYS